MLEYNLIQEHQPAFNIRYRDDKSYPYLAVTLTEQWPRPMVIRGKHKAGNKYFGPYAHAYAIRETLDLLLRTFPLRTCTNGKFKQHTQQKKPCLLFHIEKCSAPCADEISPESYQELVDQMVQFLAGQTENIVSELEMEMEKSVKALDFESAARARDRLASLQKAIESQQMVGSRLEDFDVVGWANAELETAVQVFFVRGGRVKGRRGFILDKSESLRDSELMGRVLEGIYFRENPLGAPKKVFVPHLPNQIELYASWLSDLRGSPVQILIPQRGPKRKLAETVRQNADESLMLNSLKRSQDHNSRSKALKELQQYLDLPEAPLRIECYDASHTSGQDYVGSMVVFEDALAKRRDYRHFTLQEVTQNDDYEAMREMLTRRLKRYVDSKKSNSRQGGAFSYSPGLLLVDGGKGQLSIAKRVLQEMGLQDEIPLAALAKELEEVFRPGHKDSIRMPRQSEALYLLQRIRDESHRFAVTHHRKRRSQRMKESILDDIAGLGPMRRKKLLAELGGMRGVKTAELGVLESLGWLPQSVAQAVYDKCQNDRKVNLKQ